MEPVVTARLELLPLTLANAQDLVAEPLRLGQRLNLNIADGWPGDDFAEIVPDLLNELARDPLLPSWNRLVVDRHSRTLVGTVGFVYRPDSKGIVLLGYSTAPPVRNQGIATEAARALLTWGFNQHELQVVQAICLGNNPASMRVLEKIGLRRTGDEGELVHWEVRRPQWLARQSQVAWLRPQTDEPPIFS